ncbi:MAG: ABC transporter ATP-binding protein [Calditrichaeota bacterium]|nr:ABC transporter ATP-binding protein [Calditrichota bacterium]RQW06656.1 MAG: ABC transporter ATP-binding protein [Calditrichota bacterium]
MQAIEIKNFKRNYGEVEAVKDVSLQVEKGELFGLIGPDGAGKTTLMRSICTLLKPTSGHIRVMNRDSSNDYMEIRKIIGYMPQRFSLYQDLSVTQNLEFFADLFQVPADEREKRLQRLYEFSRLKPFRNRLAGALSGGMKQKLALSCSLIHTPEILVLDEPTFGVDPLSRAEFWDILKSIREEGTTIFVSTAYMEEAELCDRVAFMYKGEIITSGPPEEIKKSYPYPLYRLEGENMRQLRSFFDAQKKIHSTQLFGSAVHVSFEEEPEEQIWQKWKEQTDKNLQHWKKESPSIEDVFMYLIKQENRS